MLVNGRSLRMDQHAMEPSVVVVELQPFEQQSRLWTMSSEMAENNIVGIEFTMSFWMCSSVERNEALSNIERNEKEAIEFTFGGLRMWSNGFFFIPFEPPTIESRSTGFVNASSNDVTFFSFQQSAPKLEYVLAWCIQYRPYLYEHHVKIQAILYWKFWWTNFETP